MEPGGSMPDSQGLSNNPYPEPNQPKVRYFLSLMNALEPRETVESQQKECNITPARIHINVQISKPQKICAISTKM
jgi:hypothetical protein